MKLYHGTDTRVLDHVLRDGLRPRQPNDTGRWAEAPSEEGFVYLTSVFPVFYALKSALCSPHPIKGVNPVIFEVDFDAVQDERCYPDEDFLRLRIETQNRIGHPIPIQCTNRFRENRQHWKLSLAELGTVSVEGTIPVEAIRRVAVIDIKECTCLYEILKTVQTASLSVHSSSRAQLGNLVAFIFGDADYKGPFPRTSQLTQEEYQQTIEDERRQFITVSNVSESPDMPEAILKSRRIRQWGGCALPIAAGGLLIGIASLLALR